MQPDAPTEPGLTWRTTLIASVLAVWLGGLVFYATLVIPIGADVLGSHTEFGFITRRVTATLNHAVSAILLILLLHRIVPAPHSSKSPARMLWTTWGLMVACQIALYFLHPWLDGLLDPAARRIADPDGFYLRHRVYLWTTGLQWFAGAFHFRGLLR